MVVFENRSAYDATLDSVATVTLTVECSPGQAREVSNFLVGVSSKAGVYGVSVDQVVDIPEQPQGEVHGEQEIQPEHFEPEAALERQGSDAEEGGQSARLGEHEDGELAGASGQGPVEGQGERDA